MTTPVLTVAFRRCLVDAVLSYIHVLKAVENLCFYSLRDDTDAVQCTAMYMSCWYCRRHVMLMYMSCRCMYIMAKSSGKDGVGGGGMSLPAVSVFQSG